MKLPESLRGGRMYLRKRNLLKQFTVLFLASALIASAQTKTPFKFKEERAKVGASPAVLWRDPTDIKTRDLFYGIGGPEHQPKGSLAFVEEKMNGVNPKFDARDTEGTLWGVKFGIEARPETAATRLIWAVGYFTNEDYYIAELPARGLPITRGQNLISDGKIQKARLKRHIKGEHKIGYWSWDKNPFAGTKELDGLKIMMELICNTDLKSDHRVIYDVNGTEQRYMITDVGASFGKAGKTFGRTKGKLSDYQELPLIRNAGPEYVDFWYFKHIPREHAKWIGGYLAQLSDAQINDAFRAAGFTAEETNGFTKKVRDKINELNQL